MSVVGKSVGDTTPVTSYQPVALVSTSGASITNADGSQDIGGVNGTSAASAANPLPTRDYGLTNLATGQVSVALTATQIAAARSARGAITIVNHGTNPVYIGTGSVTAATGILLPGVVGASITLLYGGQVAGIATGGVQTVSFLETF
jgi:hypothetical protein